MRLKVTANRIFLTDPSQVARLSSRTKREISKMMMQQLTIIQNEMRAKLFPWRSHGRQYPSRTGKGIHTASLPGYPPNQDTGKLRRGIKLKKEGPYNLVLSASVPPPDPDYAVYLEYGSNVEGKLQPRPYFYNTIEAQIKKASFKKAIRQVGYAIRNELIAQNGILKKGKWVVTK